MAFTIEIKNLASVSEMADKFPAVSEKYVGQAIRASFLRILSFIKQSNGAPVGVNNALRDQWDERYSRFEGKLSSKTKYAPYIEFGTRPHVVPVKNNIDFQKWANKKGLNPYAVAASIAKKGTRANPFFQRSIEQAQDGVNIEFGKALESITKEIIK